MLIKRTLLFISGVVFALALFELSLGLSSTFHRSPKKGSASDKTILCLGNSFTYGVGAPPEKSYPVQLQSLFDKEGKSIQVINAGQANINTRYQLNHLEEQLDLYHPGLVILQTGEPNKWNHQGFADYLKGEKGTHSTWSFFTESHTGKFISYLLLGPHQNEMSAAEVEYPLHRYRNEYWEAITWSQSVRSNPLKQSSENDRIAENHMRWLKRGMLFDSQNPQSYASLGLIYYYYYKNREEALIWAIKGMEINPHVYDMTDSVALLRVLQKNNEQGSDELIKKYEARYPHIFKTLVYENDERLWDWAQSDIEEILRILKKRNIKILLLNYPPIPRLPFSKRPIDKVIEQLANSNDVPLLNLYEIFSTRGTEPHFMKSHYWEKFGLLDEHPNAQGYGLIAHEVFKLLTNEKELKF